MKTLTWLHLSDLHACHPRFAWDADRVTETLVRDLVHLQSDHGLRPDLLFFTGDAAFGEIGSKPGETLRDQYEHFTAFLERVRTAFEPEIELENVFLVPGNHDVNRRWVSDDQTAWLDLTADRAGSVDPVRALIEQGNLNLQWRRYMERLGDYRRFLESRGLAHLLADRERLIYATTRDVHGLRVGVAGFNSAWSCCRDAWCGAAPGSTQPGTCPRPSGAGAGPGSGAGTSGSVSCLGPAPSTKIERWPLIVDPWGVQGGLPPGRLRPTMSTRADTCRQYCHIPYLHLLCLARPCAPMRTCQLWRNTNNAGKHRKGLTMELSVSEAARLLGNSERQIRYMIKNGGIPARKKEGRWTIRCEDLRGGKGKPVASVQGAAGGGWSASGSSRRCTYPCVRSLDPPRPSRA